MADDHMIAALKRERAGYVARGLNDRVAEVDEQLAHYGHTAQQDPPPDPTGAPKGRTTKPSRTATPKGGKQAAAKTTKTPETPPATPLAEPPKSDPPKGDGTGE